MLLGSVYTFERATGSSSVAAISVARAAAGAIKASINDHPEIHYQELTDLNNPRPVFAVFFPNMVRKQSFEELFRPVLEQCGLRVSVVHTFENGELDRAEQALSQRYG